jgi:homoserine dehydrogenase
MRIRGDDVYVQGITGISKSDIDYAEELGYRIKLAAEARISDQGAGVRVNPMFIPLSNPLADVDDVYNAIYIESDMSGKIMLYGRGAGAGPTASAVVGDIILIARSTGCASPAPGCTCFNESRIMPPEKARGRFYIRMNVKDNPGVLARIAGVLGDNGVSIYSVVQKKNEGSFAEIVIITHEVVCRNLENAIKIIRKLGVVDEVNNPIMVEEE